MSGRRMLLLLVCLHGSACLLGGEAAETATGGAKKKRIAMVLWRGMTDGDRGFVDYFRQRDLPVEILPPLDCAKDKARLPEIRQRLRALQPDLIYTFGTTVTKAIAGTDDTPPEDAIRDIPIVFCFVAFPEKAGIVASRDASGRNVTGVSHLPRTASLLKLMRSMVDLKRLGVIYNPAESNARAAVAELQTLLPTDAASKEAVQLLDAPVARDEQGNPRPDSLPAVVSSLAAQKPDIVFIPSDSFLIANAGPLTSALNRHGLPSFSATEAPIRDHGALMGLVSRYYNAGQFAAFKAEQILLRGKEASTLPVETLARFTLLVNMRTARTLKLYPPVSMLRYAEAVHPLYATADGP